MSHHPRCVHARSAEQARARALALEQPPAIEIAPGHPMVLMSGTLATLIDLACPLECIQGTCQHEPKQEGPVDP